MKQFTKQLSRLLIRSSFGFIVFFISYAFVTWQQSSAAKNLYEKKCARCHGIEGTKTLFGAKNLQKSNMEDDAMIQIIQNGKKIMPAYKTKLSREEIMQVADYIKTLRK
jgi:mono/diheme cytochrome c family protein